MLARGEMSTIILPVQAVMLFCALMAFLGGVPLIASSLLMRDSHDSRLRRHAKLIFNLAVVVLSVPVVAIIACLFIYGSQGGFR